MQPLDELPRSEGRQDPAPTAQTEPAASEVGGPAGPEPTRFGDWERRMVNRPLSPHISIYRFAYTMATSILHRATGLVLAAGLVLLVCFLASVARGEDSYTTFRAFAGGLWGRLLLAAFLICFGYHLANGIRHLFWDMGFGLERAEARRSAGVVVVVALALAAVVVWKVFASGVAS